MKHNNSVNHAWATIADEPQRLRIKANSSFMYMHSPQNWSLEHIKIDKKMHPVLLPELNSIRLTAGVNLVRAAGKGVNASRAVADAEDQGFTVIDNRKYDYIRVYPCINGRYHSDKFTSFEQIGNHLLQNFDHDAFNMFRCELMREGAIAPPHKHFIKILILDNQKLIDKYAQLQHNPNHEALYKKAIQKDKDLKQAKADLEKHGVEVYG